MFGVIFSGFIAVADRLQRMPVRHERLMRRMGIVFPDLVMLGSLAVISHGLLVVIGSGCVVFCYPVLGGCLLYTSRCV